MGKKTKKVLNTRSRAQLDKNGEFIIPFGMYKGKKVRSVPLDYLHWLMYTKDQATEWIKEKQPQAFKAAEGYFINYEKYHVGGKFGICFGRYKGKKISEVPHRYLTWLANKGKRESINWVRDNYPDAVINAQNYLKNNNLCFKCGKKVEERILRKRLRIRIGFKMRNQIGKKIHKECQNIAKIKTKLNTITI